MKKHMFIFAILLSSLASAQTVWNYDNGSIENPYDYSVRATSDFVNYYPVYRICDSSVFEVYVDSFIVHRWESSYNDGEPTSIIWSTPDGQSRRSPVDSLPFLKKTDTLSLSNRIDAINGNPAGAVLQYAGSSAPSGYLMCDGSAVSRTTYASLFSVIGTTYGAGNGTTTFNVPDCRQRFILDKAASGTGSTLGSTGGAIDHVHSVDPPNTTSTGPSATTNNISLIGLGSAASASSTHNVDITAFNSASANPPFIVMNAIIKY